MTPLLMFDNLLYQLTELRQTLTYIYQFIIKDIIKNINKQPDAEVYRARSIRALSTEASVSMELESTTLLAHGYVHQPGGSPNPIV